MDGMNAFAMDNDGRPQSGIGKGRGNGRPPKDEPKTGTRRETQVRQKPGRGPAVFAGTVEGPNIKAKSPPQSNKKSRPSATRKPTHSPPTASPATAANTPRSTSIHSAKVDRQQVSVVGHDELNRRGFPVMDHQQDFLNQT